MADDDRIEAQEHALASQHLTKSRYIAGLQCLRRLWLSVNEPVPHEQTAPGSPMDVGQKIGRKAHLLFPGGALVDEEPWRHAQAVARTSALMLDQRVPAIFEGAAINHIGTSAARVHNARAHPPNLWEGAGSSIQFSRGLSCARIG